MACRLLFTNPFPRCQLCRLYWHRKLSYKYEWQIRHHDNSWWLHQKEAFSTLLAIYAGNSVTGEFPTQRPVTRSFDVFFDLRLNKRLSKQWWDWWFETPSRSLWRHCNVIAREVSNRVGQLIHRVNIHPGNSVCGDPDVADRWLSWWRHQMETFSVLPAICAGNSPVTGEFPTQRPVTWSFDVFFDLRLNKRLSK